VHVLLEFLCEPLEAFGVFGHRTDIFLKDDWLRRGGTDHVREPPEVGWTPSGPAGRADVVSEQKGFEPKLGGLQIPYSIFTCAAEVADGFVFHRRDLDSGEIA
jgi:hypothetical protein